jgi:hypothetical protein
MTGRVVVGISTSLAPVRAFRSAVAVGGASRAPLTVVRGYPFEQRWIIMHTARRRRKLAAEAGHCQEQASSLVGRWLSDVQARVMPARRRRPGTNRWRAKTGCPHGAAARGPGRSPLALVLARTPNGWRSPLTVDDAVAR